VCAKDGALFSTIQIIQASFSSVNPQFNLTPLSLIYKPALFCVRKIYHSQKETRRSLPDLPEKIGSYDFIK